MNPPKVCFTTYIYGDKYQNFIPWVLYSVGKSYPEYHVIIFINGALRDDLRPLIDKIKGNFDIVENTFNDCPKMVPVKAQSLRWVLWHEKFKEFDYLYYIDVDMLFIREPIPMHEQHIRHMNFIGSDCVSNILRRKVLPHGIKDWYTTYFNLKYGGGKICCTTDVCSVSAACVRNSFRESIYLFQVSGRDENREIQKVDIFQQRIA